MPGLGLRIELGGSLAGGGGLSVPPQTFNLKRSNTSIFAAAAQGMAGNVPVICWGDSIVRGQSTGGGTTQFALGWPQQLVGEMRNRGYSAGGNNLFGSGGQWGLAATMANVETGDPRVSHTGAWLVGANITSGGLNYQSAAAGGMSVAFAEATNKANIWFRDNTAGRSYTWRFDGGATTQVDSVAVDQVRRIDIDMGTTALHTLTVDWVLGTPVICGFNSYDDSGGRKEISFYGWGHSGASSTQLAATTFTAAAGINMLALMSPKLVIIEGGIGNSWRTSISIAQTKTDVTNMVIAAKAAGANVILLSTPWDSSGSGLAAQQSDYILMLYQVATEQDVPLIDQRLRAGWTSTADEVAHNFVSDSVHPFPLGYADMTQMIADVITWIISGSVQRAPDPPPGGQSYLTGLDGKYLLGADGAYLLGTP